MSVLRYKLWHDLWKNKGRTLQVVLIIAMGATAIGLIIGTRNLVIPAMQAGWQASNPAMINLIVDPSFDDDDLVVLGDVDGVVEIEGQSSTSIEYRIHPDDEWKTAGLIARADYEQQKMNKVALAGGDWPSGDVLAVEQGAEANFSIPEDGQVYIRANKREYRVNIGGTLYNQLVAPASFGGTAQFYVTRDHYGELTGDRDFNQLMARAAEYDEEAVTAIADRLQEKVEKQGKDSSANFPGRVADPEKHFFQDSLDGLFFFLGIMGFLALLLGLFLVYNTISALVSQQVDQIGIMKAIGARSGQILRFFLTMIFVYGLLALVIAIPVGAIGAWVLSNWLVGGFNAAPGSFTFSPLAILVQVAIALLTPLLVALIPIFSGARITVREAINTYGLNAKPGLIDRLLAKTERLSRLFLLTISNTFRRKWRVVLTQITLVLSGLIFMMVISLQDSVVYTFGEVLFSILNFNVNMVFKEPERIARVEELTLAYPGVTAAEMWGFAGGTIHLASEPESEDDESAFVLGIPLPTELYGYQIRAGRWLLPEDTYAVVLNQELAKEAGVGIGDWVTIKLNDTKEVNWQVVGLVFDPILTTSAQVPRATLVREIGQINRASTVWLQTEQDGLVAEEATAKGLRDYYEANGIEVSAQRGVFGGASESATATGNTIINQFNFIVVLLGIMAVIIGAVGSIALSGTLALGVMERRREIGVMRAIGASSWSVALLFIGEGLILGWLSWLIALPFTIPAGQIILQAMGSAFGIDLIYKYTPTGAVLWLIIITVLSILASWLPARSAIGISVRESLAYQ